MEESKKVGQNKSRLLLIARIWSGIVIAICLFIFSGSIVDLFRTGTTDPNVVENYPFIENLPPIFSFLSAIGLALAWKWKLIGGLIAICLCTVNFVIYFIHWPLTENINYLIAPYGINLFIMIPGIMFVVLWRRQNKLKSSER
ncbi:MAG: hypothetical protein U9O65_00225 [Thermotogota bacterium]|nr:hypothetical protein [Thermotogota bacterium]